MHDNALELKLFQYPSFSLGAANGKDFRQKRFSGDVRGTGGQSIFKRKNNGVLIMNKGTFQDGKTKGDF